MTFGNLKIFLSQSLIIFMISFLVSSCATKGAGPRRQIDLAVGKQNTTNTPDTEAEKSGYLYYLRYYKGYQTTYLGQMGWAAGFQETHQEGRLGDYSQILVNRAGFIDLSYFLPSGESTFQIGVLYRTLIGKGSQYGMNEREEWQTLSMVGPVIQKGMGASFVIGAALLRSTNLEKRNVTQIPIYIGWKF